MSTKLKDQELGVIAEFPSSTPPAVIRIRLMKKGVNVFIDMRLFYKNGDEMIPSSKGFRTPVDSINEIAEAIENTREALEGI